MQLKHLSSFCCRRRVHENFLLAIWLKQIDVVFRLRISSYDNVDDLNENVTGFLFIT